MLEAINIPAASDRRFSRSNHASTCCLPSRSVGPALVTSFCLAVSCQRTGRGGRPRADCIRAVWLDRLRAAAAGQLRRSAMRRRSACAVAASVAGFAAGGDCLGGSAFWRTRAASGLAGGAGALVDRLQGSPRGASTLSMRNLRACSMPICGGARRSQRGAEAGADRRSPRAGTALEQSRRS